MKTLEDLTTQYQSDSEALNQLRQDEQNAQKELEKLEADIDGDLDANAKKAVQLNGVVQECAYKTKAITRRQEKLREQILAVRGDVKQLYREAEKEAQKQRRANAQALINSDEWKGVHQKLIALQGLEYWRQWDSVLAEATPRAPDLQESRQAAIDLGLWIDEPDEPESIKYAESVIGYDKFNDGE